MVIIIIIIIITILFLWGLEHHGDHSWALLLIPRARICDSNPCPNPGDKPRGKGNLAPLI